MRLSATMSLLVLVCFAGAVRTARAQVPAEVMAVQHPDPVGVELSLGGRTDRLGGDGFAPFSGDRWMAESMVGASYRLAGARDRGVTMGASWNHGRASSTARGAAASLELDRLSLSLGGHRAVWRRLTIFGRLAPGVVRLKAAMSESSVLNAGEYGNDTTLSQTHWALALEAAAGAAFRVLEVARPREHVFALWLTAEGGYGLTGSTTLALASNRGQAPAQTDVPVHLGSVTPGGAFLNFAAALTF
jgi:hypothetical protein